MQYRLLLRQRPDAFVREITQHAGYRLRRVKGTDLEQAFWLGVLEAITRMRDNGKQLHYLLSAGFGAMRDYMRSEYSRSLTRWCPQCGRWVGYRTNHEHAVVVMPREKPYLDSEDGEVDLALDGEREREYFAKSLEPELRIFFSLWLQTQDQGRIGEAMGLSPTRISQLKRQVALRLAEWRGLPEGAASD